MKTIYCPIDECHNGAVAWGDMNTAIEKLSEDHKDGKHDKLNEIVNSEPDVSKRDWSKL